MTSTTARIEALYRQHNRQLVRQLARSVDADQAQDVAADTWIILARKLEADPDYLHEDTARSWLFVTARNLARAEHHKHTGRRADLDDGQHHLTLRVTGGRREPELFDWIAQRDANRRLAELLRDPSVPLNRRRALAGRMLGLSYAEMMQRFGWTYTATDRYVNETRKLARQRCSIEA